MVLAATFKLSRRFLSNGFKIRITNNVTIMASGKTYMSMAFAEAPLVSSNGVAATGRLDILITIHI